jgi:hypothetical protein
MSKIKFIVLAIVLSAIGVVSMTASAAPIKPSGFYLEGSLGMSNSDLALDDTDFAYNFSFGYKINPFIAIEAGLTEDKSALYDLAVKGILPFSNGISLFGKIGLGLENGDTFTLDLEPVTYFAGGASYNITPRLAVFIEESAVTSASEENIDGRYFSLIGLNYTF